MVGLVDDDELRRAPVAPRAPRPPIAARVDGQFQSAALDADRPKVREFCAHHDAQLLVEELRHGHAPARALQPKGQPLTEKQHERLGARREDDVAALVERLDGARDSHKGLPAAGWRRQQNGPRSSCLDERASLVRRELLKAEQRRREALRERAAVDSDRLYFSFSEFLVQGPV